MANRITSSPLAHIDSATNRAHLLEDHGLGVAALATRFGERFGAGPSAYFAGQVHDFGKYPPNFQNMIREENGYEAHLEEIPGAPRDHSTAGAILAMRRFGVDGLPLAFVIAGHHCGLQDAADLKERLKAKGALCDHALRARPPSAVADGPLPSRPAFLSDSTSANEKGLVQRRLEMWIRMLFSALCDADFLDTEAFFDPAQASHRGHGPAPSTLRAKLENHLRALEAEAADTEVNRVRREVREACIAAASQRPGVFSLTVPTGGGKTLSSMAFALSHAAHHGLDRVVVAIPFTSIIEQNAEEYRAALGLEAVLEHHTALDPRRTTPLNRLASENWDSPVAVTTTVQLLESLFARRTSTCRKLHRLAKSVIVLDEAQTLPPGLLSPILDAFSGDGPEQRDDGRVLVRMSAGVVRRGGPQACRAPRSIRLPSRRRPFGQWHNCDRRHSGIGLLDP